ncbi:MAG: DUF6715 family protein [Lachnospiraceae bacterium]
MKKSLRNIFVCVICAGLCIGYYYYLSHRDAVKEKELTEVEMVITKDLDSSYPKTAREVVKFYNRILQCYYNEKHTEKELMQLTNQAGILMDQELRKQNPKDMYLESVKSDIANYKDKDKTIVTATTESANEVDYKTVENAECAYVDASYYIKEGKTSQRSSQTYILRKDDKGMWRMLGFYQ